MKVVVAPDSFKGSLSAAEVARAIGEGLGSVWTDARIELVPLADGGEGTVDALVAATGGRTESVTVAGPLQEPVIASFGMLGSDDTAVLEMASASGLPLVRPEQRNPLKTTTYGTGQLVAAALEHGVRRLIVGIGGSATVDGGAGCAQALGMRFLDSEGRALRPGVAGGELQQIDRIDASGLDPRLREVEVLVACDVDNPLCGPHGAAAIYGPQKGATPEMVTQLDRGLDHLAGLIQRDLGVSVAAMPGAGAAGGLGAGLVAFCNANLRPGIDIVMQQLGLQERIERCDLVVTGEGCLDGQSVRGKTISGVGRLARRAGVPVVALVGSVGDGAELALDIINAYLPIIDRPMDLACAMERTSDMLKSSAANLARIWVSSR
jgi:glycerate kinase